MNDVYYIKESIAYSKREYFIIKVTVAERFECEVVYKSHPNIINNLVGYTYSHDYESFGYHGKKFSILTPDYINDIFLEAL